MKKSVIALAFMLLLAGCAAPKVLVSTPKTVLISNVRSGDAARALEMAEAKCQKYGKHAVYVPDNVHDGQATYECKE